MFELEEGPDFWQAFEALDALGQRDAIAKAVNDLTTWVVENPLRAAAGADDVRVVKLPSPAGSGLPSLRLAYYLKLEPRPNGVEGVVVLLDVGPYDQIAELLDGNAVPSRWH
ncbi:MAG TPA: hypothetical protein VGQ36_03705 [Thermoanaerobaculia bacterium]|jgi:hypothetical protein|nr:hypothetical protein [Thermoanaerobaculia bacterium]